MAQPLSMRCGAIAIQQGIGFTCPSINMAQYFSPCPCGTHPPPSPLAPTCSCACRSAYSSLTKWSLLAWREEPRLDPDRLRSTILDRLFVDATSLQALHATR